MYYVLFACVSVYYAYFLYHIGVRFWTVVPSKCRVILILLLPAQFAFYIFFTCERTYTFIMLWSF